MGFDVNPHAVVSTVTMICTGDVPYATQPVVPTGVWPLQMRMPVPETSFATLTAESASSA